MHAGMSSGDGRTYWFADYEVEIVAMKDGWVHYRYLNPSPSMKRDKDGKVYGKIRAAAFAAQNRRGR